MLTALGRGIRAGHTGEPVAAAEIGLDEIAVPAQRFAQCGDLSRHVLLRNNARQLMAYLGRVRSEHSSDTRIRRGGIAKAGNVLARRVLIEGAQTYLSPTVCTSEPGLLRRGGSDYCARTLESEHESSLRKNRG
jgi:hypothetical protein